MGARRELHEGGDMRRTTTAPSEDPPDYFQQLVGGSCLGHDMEPGVGEQTGDTFAEEDPIVSQGHPHRQCRRGARSGEQLSRVVGRNHPDHPDRFG